MTMNIHKSSQYLEVSDCEIAAWLEHLVVVLGLGNVFFSGTSSDGEWISSLISLSSEMDIILKDEVDYNLLCQIDSLKNKSKVVTSSRR